jgi:hypothetical protein
VVTLGGYERNLLIAVENASASRGLSSQADPPPRFDRATAVALRRLCEPKRSDAHNRAVRTQLHGSVPCPLFTK